MTTLTKWKKSGGHSTAGTGVGRPAGINKNKRLFGYKYTEEEFNEMWEELEKFKKENNYTTSKALYILVTNANKK